MGAFFKVFGSAKNKEFYQKELQKQEVLVAKEREKNTKLRLIEEAKFDALPASERGKQRLATGFNRLKQAAVKANAFSNRVEQKYREQGGKGGIIQQSYQRDRKEYTGGLIEQSLRGTLEKDKPVKRKKVKARYKIIEVR